MKKTLSMAFICLFFAFNLSAQKITFGAEILFDGRNFVPTELLGKYENNYFVLMRDSKKYFIQCYPSSNNLKMDKEIDVKQKVGKNELVYSCSFMSKNIIHVFYTVYSKKEKLCHIFLQSYDENLMPKGDLRKLMTVIAPNKTSSFALFKSPSENKICIIGEDDYKDNEPQKFFFTVYDASMQEEWSKKITLPCIRKLFDYPVFRVTESGGVCVAGKKYNEKIKEKRNDEVNYTYEVFFYTKEGISQQKEIYLDELSYLYDVKVFVSKNNTINIVGYFSEESKGYKVAKGVFTVAFDKDMNIIARDQKEFSENFLANFAEGTRKDKELRNFEIKHIFENEGGGFKVITEQSYVNSRASFTRRTASETEITICDGDIIIVDLDKDLKIKDKMQQVSKDQMTKYVMQWFYVRPTTQSYVPSKNGTNLYLMFNDNIKNANTIAAKKVEVAGYETAFFSVKIDSNGDVKKNLLFANKGDSFAIYPKWSRQINEKEVIIYSEIANKKRTIDKYSFSIITFE